MKNKFEALEALVAVCAHKTGQGRKVRGLLYSLWNGRAYSLLEIICLDQAIRQDLLVVLANFGSNDFFYTEIKRAFVAAGLFDWFIEEGDQ